MDMQQPSEHGPDERNDGIAIIGMAGIFPGAPELDDYWQNIVTKVYSITDPPPEAWDAGIYYDPDSTENDRIYCKKGGFLGPIAFFNPLKHGIMPRRVEGGEPDQWLALEVAQAAMENAGYPDGPHDEETRRRTAVIIGKGTYINRGNLSLVQHSLVVDQTLVVLRSLHPELTDEEMARIRLDLKSQLPPFNAETAPGLVPNAIAGRVANRLDLMGPSYTVDGACASSLIALENAVRGLRNREFDLAIVGGAQVTTPIPILDIFAQLRALSHGEEIRPFDAGADGTILSEGIGMVVLKRADAARRDNDRIYAVIRGVGVASDGRGLGILAPRLEGEELALRRAYEDAGVSPSTIGLIEAHGTATVVGDATELKALTHVFGARDGALPHCAVGSVKSQIGHTMPAAGIAGLIKVALALYHKVLPPTLNVDRPNPDLGLDDSPFYINTETRPWISGRNAPRRAGVNSFGFGGINAHVVLEEGPEEARPISHQRGWDHELFILRGEDREGLIEAARRLQGFLQREPEVMPHDLAYTLNLHHARLNDDGGLRLAIIAATLPELAGKVDRALERLNDPSRSKIKARNGLYFFQEPLGREGKLAFVFPGEGAQYIQMMADLAIQFPAVRAVFEETDRAFAGHSRGFVLSDVVFPRPAFSDAERREAEERLWQMDVAVESLVTANHAMFTLLERLGLRPDAMVGHSTGEYASMRAAGMLDLDGERYSQNVLELNRRYEEVAARGEIPRAVLLAIGAGRDEVQRLVDEVNRDDLLIAMDNCPHQVVLVGSESAAEQVMPLIRQKGLLHERLRFDRAYHTPMFGPYADVLREFLATWIIRPPTTTLYSCTTRAPFPQGLDAVRDVAHEHWIAPVEFRRTIEQMHEDGVRLFVEVGPRGNMTSFMDDILRGRPYAAIPSNLKRRSGISQLMHLLGTLSAHAVPLDLAPLYERRQPRRVDLERPEDPYGDRRMRAGRVLLETGWPPMDLLPETVTRLRESLMAPAAPPPPTAPAPAAAAPSPAPTPAPTPAPSAPGQKKPTVSAPPRTQAQDRPLPFQRVTTTSDQPAAPPPEAAAVNPEREQPIMKPPDPGPPNPAALPAGADHVMASYMATMEQFLAVQLDVMQRYLASSDGRASAPAQPLPRALPARTPRPLPAAPPAPAPQAVAPAPPPVAVTPPPPVAATPAPAPAPAPQAVTPPPAPQAVTPPPAPAPVAAASDGPAVIEAALVRLVAERTGYPPEMLDRELDLEADLGIDSIKRVEIIGGYQQESGMQLGEAVEALSARKTLAEMVDFLVDFQNGGGGGAVTNGAGQNGTSSNGSSAVATNGTEAAPAADPAAIEATLVRLVAERTGYPPEMLDRELDLEADLGIDSIKRVEIIGGYQQESGVQLGEGVEALSARKTLAEMVEFLVDFQDGGGGSPSGSRPAGAAEGASVPFEWRPLTLTPGEEVVAQVVIRREAARFLQDHTLGREVSTFDPSLWGLPVVPLTMSMELMSEAAAMLCPGLAVVGMNEVRGARWITVESSAVTLRAHARLIRSGDESQVFVRLFDASEPAERAVAIVSATIRLAPAFPTPPAVPPPARNDSRPSAWRPDDLYTRGIFHGPAFRGIESIDGYGEWLSEATVRVLPRTGLFSGRDGTGLLTDPVLLDQPGQVIAFWLWERLDRGHIIFPYRLERLDLFGPPLPAGTRLKCVGRVTAFDALHMRSDLDLVREDGTLWARLTGWEDRRFTLPVSFSDFMLSPAGSTLTRPWHEVEAAGQGLTARRIGTEDFPEQFLSAHGGIWRKVLAHGILSAGERLYWQGLRTPLPRRIEWLLGRMAAKDAVRAYVQSRHGISLRPADVEILPDDAGRPLVGGAWVEQIGETPVVSIAHTAGSAAAIVGSDLAGLGVDLERVGRLNEAVEAAAFTDEERMLLAGTASGEAWPLRLWCAKEAVAKALGTGLRGGPRALIARAIDPQSGDIEIALAGKLEGRLGAGVTLTAQTGRSGEWIRAIVVRAASERV